jgi:cell division protein FtsX
MYVELQFELIKQKTSTDTKVLHATTVILIKILWFILIKTIRIHFFTRKKNNIEYLT